jgi:phosphatidylinositol alpha 1,6-mannosyltransferase
MTGRPPRVAFFTDCFHEVNGVALTSRQLDGFARGRALPFFSVHVGPKTTVRSDGAYTAVELQRSAASIPLDAGMSFDTLGLRHRELVKRELRRFRPDVIHITGPGDCGLLGALLAWDLRVPLVASWHTNLHEFGARRLERALTGFVSKNWAQRAGSMSERWILRRLITFYGMSRVLLAPNPELTAMLQSATAKPTFLMQRGVDADLFSPDRRCRADSVFTIGYVGRLSPEKNVHILVEIEQHLLRNNLGSFRIIVVGQGSEREWLERNLSGRAARRRAGASLRQHGRFCIPFRNRYLRQCGAGSAGLRLAHDRRFWRRAEISD